MPMAMTRRGFLGSVAAGAAAARGSISGLFAAQGTRQLRTLGLQLYTVRDQMGKDVERTLAEVAAAGYKEVEFAGYFDKSPQEIKAILGRTGLTAPSTHIPYATIGEKWQKALDDSAIIGHRSIVIPWLDDETRKQPDVWKKVAANLNLAGEATKKAGLQLAYHNHNFEFVPANGAMPFDYLLEQCGKDIVKIEMDLCWTVAAGQDPIAYFKKHPGRITMVHVKDLKKIPASAAVGTGPVIPDITDVGAGVIDWKKILGAAYDAKVEHYFVEHDAPADPFASIKASEKYLEALRF
jgi:sugar phosphate isomerase/epimerase